MTLEESMMERMALNMARAIDKELLDDFMIDVLLEEGWTQTNINPGSGKMYQFDWYIETAEWIHLNDQGASKLLKGQWLFEDPKDATMFILRWS